MPSQSSNVQKKGKAGDEEVHVAIDSPGDVRRCILESAKESVGILQRERKLNELRSIKLDSVKEISIIFKDILSLNARLERLMPKVNLPKPASVNEIDEEFREVERPTEKISTAARLDEFEQELAEIEKRISSLR